MSLIVRDEADVIGHNVAFHARHGVDTFAVLDNGSEDGTYELLQSLRDEFDIALFRDADGFRKEERSMMLAGHLRERLGATHLISNDADEFWVPRQPSLKALATPDQPVKRAGRFNFVVTRAESVRPDYRFFHSTMLVVRPWGRAPAAPDPSTPLAVPMALRTMPGKVLCALDGLRHVVKGNHRVEHDAGEAVETDEAVVLHYPVRSYEQFERKVRNHGTHLAGVAGKESWHLRRWHALLAAGRLREEYETLLFDDTAVRTLVDDGTLREERVLAEFFAAADRPGAGPRPGSGVTTPRDP